MGDRPAPGQGPVNVRARDRITGIELPVDTVYAGYDEEEGGPVYNIVNLPEWYDPNHCMIEADGGPEGMVLRAKIQANPDLLRHVDPKQLMNEIGNMQQAIFVSTFTAECSLWRSQVYSTGMWLLFVLFFAFTFTAWSWLLVVASFVLLAVVLLGTSWVSCRVVKRWRMKSDRD